MVWRDRMRWVRRDFSLHCRLARWTSSRSMEKYVHSSDRT